MDDILPERFESVPLNPSGRKEKTNTFLTHIFYGSSVLKDACIRYPTWQRVGERDVTDFYWLMNILPVQNERKTWQNPDCWMFSRTDVIDPDSSAPARQNDSEWGGFANVLDEQLKFRTEFVAQGSGRVAAVHRSVLRKVSARAARLHGNYMCNCSGRRLLVRAAGRRCRQLPSCDRSSL